MEQRTAVRIAVRLRALLLLDDGVVEAMVGELSRQGLFLQTTWPVTVGMAVTVCLELPGESIRVPGWIARLERSNLCTGVGIRFVEPASNPYSLVNYLMRCHALGA